MKVAFCPTQNMLADFFTKPLQGSMFICMRENILNLPVNANTKLLLDQLRDVTQHLFFSYKIYTFLVCTSQQG